MNPSPFSSPRVPLKRVPLARGEKELSRGDSRLSREIPLKAVSRRRAAENRLRRKVVGELFPERPACVGPCGGQWADDVHEPLTRGRGGSIVDPENMRPLCRACHDLVTFAPESELGWAYEAGRLVHSWDAPKAGEVA